jgi:hypothetical protein
MAEEELGETLATPAGIDQESRDDTEVASDANVSDGFGDGHRRRWIQSHVPGEALVVLRDPRSYRLGTPEERDVVVSR